MKTPRLCSAMLLISALAAGSVHANEGPFTLRLGSWVCQTPQAYDNAIEQQKQEPKVWELAKKLLDEGACIYMDDDNLEDMLAPYIVTVEQQNNMSKVSFFVEFYKRVAMLHRKIRHVKFVGWTETDNIIKHRQAN